MEPEQVLRIAPKALSDEQRRFYFDNGYVLIEGVIDAGQLAKLRGTLAELEARAQSDADLPADFEFESPVAGERRLRQVLCSSDHSVECWRYASDSRVTEIAADVLGPDIRFRESNVSFKSPGGRGFDWHQDIVFFPSSNSTPLMSLTFIEDVTTEMGPTRVIPGSHRGEIYDHYDQRGNWVGLVAEHEKPRLPVQRAVDVVGPAGSVLLTNCRVLHAARANESSKPRPMVITGYNSADTVAMMDVPYRSRYRWRVVRGHDHGRVHSESMHFKMPPDWADYAGIRIDNLYQS